MKLIVGTDSTWSLRAFICAQIADIEINLKIIDLSKKDYKTEILKYSPTGLIPVLDTGSYIIHDSLAITEFFNEYSKGSLFPNSQQDRAISRSLCAELHSGFTEIRNQCSFSFKKQEPLVKISDRLKKELDRVCNIFEMAQTPYMFDFPGVVDAFYSVMAYRLQSYGIDFSGNAGVYQRSLLNWPIFTNTIDSSNKWKKS
jgi:glutathione S-transferase